MQLISFTLLDQWLGTETIKERKYTWRELKGLCPALGLITWLALASHQIKKPRPKVEKTPPEIKEIANL